MLPYCRAAENKPLAKLSSTKLWAPNPRRAIGRSWIKASPPLRRCNYSEEDWATALEEAVQTSYPPLTCRHATEAEWDAALEEAVQLSTRTDTRFTDDVPDFIRAQVEALEQERMIVEQVARELYAQQQEQQLLQRRQEKLLWTKPSTVQQTESKGALWSPGLSSSLRNAVFVQDGAADRQRLKRRKMMAQSNVVEVVADQGMWRASKRERERDWTGEFCQRKEMKVGRVMLRY
jgi:hypothetical protein